MALLTTELKSLGVTNFLLRKIKPFLIVILQLYHVLTQFLFFQHCTTTNAVVLFMVINNNEIYMKKKPSRSIPSFLASTLSQPDNWQRITAKRYHSYLVMLLQFYVTIVFKVWRG